MFQFILSPRRHFMRLFEVLAPTWVAQLSHVRQTRSSLAGSQQRGGRQGEITVRRERGQVRTHRAVLDMDQSELRTLRWQPIRGQESVNHAAAPDTEWEESLSSAVTSLLTKCQIKYCYKHFLNRSIESTYIPIFFLLLKWHRIAVCAIYGLFCWGENFTKLWPSLKWMKLFSGRTAGGELCLFWELGGAGDGMWCVGCGVLGAWRLF